MPNWCQGTLKVRGEYDNLKAFLENALKECAYGGEPPKEPLIEITEYENETSVIIRRMSYLEGTYRGFVEGDTEVFIDRKPGSQIVLLEAMFAWSIKTEDLQHLSQKYGVDLKITAFEQGMQFERDIEIAQGHTLIDVERRYKDYVWMCPCPMKGG